MEQFLPVFLQDTAGCSSHLLFSPPLHGSVLESLSTLIPHVTSSTFLVVDFIYMRIILSKLNLLSRLSPWTSDSDMHLLTWPSTHLYPRRLKINPSRLIPVLHTKICPSNSTYHLGWWQLHRYSCSDQNPWQFLYASVSNTSHPNHQQVPLNLLSKYIQSSTTWPLLMTLTGGPGYHHLLPGLLQ